MRYSNDGSRTGPMNGDLDPADPASGQDCREALAFADGFRYASEWMIAAHDPLLGLAALYSARAPALGSVEVDAYVLETMEAVRRVREDQAQALTLWRLARGDP